MTNVRPGQIAGLNGFGRFGLTLLWWWFRDSNAPYSIAFINDETLNAQKIYEIITTDLVVTGFRKHSVFLQGNRLLLQTTTGKQQEILVPTGEPECAGWIGQPDLFFECSGKRQNASMCRPFLVGNTSTVIISAIVPDADGTFLAGFNEKEFRPNVHRVISSGSCTVHPGVILSHFMHKNFGVESCTVNIIHSVSQWRLDAKIFNTLRRRPCSLETVAPKFLDFLSSSNLKVNYTLIPWGGVSILDFAFRVKKQTDQETVINATKAEIGAGGALENLIGLVPTDSGPEVHLGSTFSASIVESHIDVRGDTVHLFCYFYNEGSSIRLHELSCHVANEFRKRE